MRFLKGVALVCMVVGISSATYVNTAIDTVITTNTETVTLGYTVAGVSKFSNKKYLASPQTVSITGHGGLHWTQPLENQTVVAGERYQIPMTIINSGNFNDTVSANLIKGSRFSTDEWASALDITEYTIPREGVGQFVLSVTASATAEDAEVGELIVSFNGNSSYHYGEYVGSNDSPYGGSKSLSRAMTFTVNAPNISITKNAQVVAPNSWIALGGNVSDPVPGAKIVYSLDYQNTGSATANTVEINDLIPLDTELLAATGGTITYSDGTNSFAYTDGLTPAARSISWALGNLGSSATGNATFTVVIK